MNKKILTATLLLSMVNVAHASFFDSLFGKNDETTAASAKAETSVSSVAAQATGLLPTLKSELGVTDAQAEGGLGSLMNLAKTGLSTTEFSQLSSNVPNMSALLAAAPALTSSTGQSLTNMLSSAGGLTSSIGSVAQLTSQFKALGLSSDMIAKFAEVAMTYFSKNDDAATSNLLQKGLSSILG